ncbi:MAG: hypothetical protein BWY21_02372 [Parcubacteria group bacterium ADurb.Bin216]|nr:MAG: hypothetical protein BWY21_02372 [Parcubacteria group bacterium ADurb.Bin216]
MGGCDTSNSGRGLLLEGKPVINERSLYLLGYIRTSSTRDLYLGGIDTGTSERNLYTQGTSSSTSNRSFYIQGSISTNNERGLYLIGKSLEGERGLYLHGFETGSSEKKLYLEGANVGYDNRGLYISGLVEDLYFRESASDLENDDTVLTIDFLEQDYSDIGSDDNVYVNLEGTARYMKFLFKKFNENESNTQKFTITWKGKSSVTLSTNPVYLQIYNRVTGQWETLASNNTDLANTKFTLIGTQSTNLSDYYDNNYVISVRVYQEVNNGTGI